MNGGTECKQVFFVRVGTRRRITVPWELRRKYGLAAGDTVILMAGETGFEILTEKQSH